MKPYNAGKIPFRGELDFGVLLKPLLSANSNVSKFSGMLEEQFINEDLFLNPLIKREAQLSSQIEGTQVTLIEVMEIEADNGKSNDKNKNNDFVEIKNYNEAINYATKEIKDKKKLNLWLFRSMHKLLLNGVRGENKTPGAFRVEQNWIGRPGCSQEDASFIPVAQEKMQEALDDFENYICDYNEDSFLIQAAIIHAQFEKIHPFNDGNGRIGRILIPLFLYYKNMISRPAIYVSEYFEKNKEEYIDKLKAVNNDSGWEEWILFFLKAVDYQATENIRRIKELQGLHEEYSCKIKNIINSKNGIDIVNVLFKNPIFKMDKMYEELGLKIDVDKVTIRRYIRKLVDEGILTPEKDKINNRKYYFTVFLEKLK